VVNVNALRHDNENRIVDNAIHVMQTTTETIQHTDVNIGAVRKTVEALGNAGVFFLKESASFIWWGTKAATVYTITTAVNAVISGGNSIVVAYNAHRARQKFEDGVDRASDALERTGGQLGAAATSVANSVDSISSDVHATGNSVSTSCRLLSTAIAVAALAIVGTLITNSVCNECSPASKATMILGVLGVGGGLMAFLGASRADRPPQQEDSQSEEASLSEHWYQSNQRTGAMLTQTDAILTQIENRRKERLL